MTPDTPVPPEPDTLKELYWKTQDHCQVIDVDDCLWDVREARATKHGFDLLFGFPANSHLDTACWGLPRLIATPQLKAFWDANRIARDGTLYDLPAGRTTLKRVRNRLGLNSIRDLDTFFRSRVYDLERLSPREFAKKHNVPIDAVRDRRFRILGSIARPLDWWQEPESLRILSSYLSNRQIGEKLGIGTSHAFRLRQKALAYLNPTDERIHISRPRTRPADWWTKPEAIQILTSDLRSSEIARKFGITLGHAIKMRKQARALAGHPLAA